MAVRKFKPVTPGQRHKVAISFDTITTSSLKRAYLFLIIDQVEEMILVK